MENAASIQNPAFLRFSLVKLKEMSTVKRKRKSNQKTKSYKIKPEKCSPYSKGRSIVPNSCFTKGTILDLKTTYNKYNPHKIHSNDPQEVHQIIQKRLPQCEKESCWVQHVEKDNVKNKLLSLLFAPAQPHEWKNNPSAWLSNYDILGVLNQYEKTFAHFFFIGPSSIDYDFKKPEDDMRCVCPNLCNFNLQDQYTRGKRQIGIVFNLDKHDQGGSHWVSLFIDLDAGFVFYFDSTAAPIPPQIKTFVKTVLNQSKTMKLKLKYYENKRMEHQLQNNECGMYSLFFIITLLIKEKDGEKLTTADTIALFLGKKGRITDKSCGAELDTLF